MNKPHLVKLSELCKIQSGGTPRRGVDRYYEGDIPWAKIGDIENSKNGYLYKTVESITKEGLSSINNRLFPKNTVLLAMYGSVGKTAITAREMATNQAILGLQPKNTDILNIRFLKYWLDYSKDRFIKQARGVALQNISATIVKDSLISLPEIEEQIRIVNLLDQADLLRQKRKQAIDLLDEYLKSVFLEMFGDPVGNSKKLQLIKYGEIIDDIRYGSSRKSDYDDSDDKIPILRIPNIAKGSISYDDLQFQELPKREKEKLQLKKDDTLFVRTNGNPDYIGKCAVFNGGIDCIYASYLIRVRLKDKSAFLPEFVRFCFSMDSYKHKIRKESRTTAGNYNINTQGIRNFELIKPAVEEQKKFIEQKLKIDALKVKMLNQSEELDNQFQTMMQKSFTSINQF